MDGRILGGLRKSGFWEEQGNTGIYAIPLEGECGISAKELEETFQIMDQGCHGREYLDYLAYCSP